MPGIKLNLSLFIAIVMACPKKMLCEWYLVKYAILMVFRQFKFIPWFAMQFIS